MNRELATILMASLMIAVSAVGPARSAADPKGEQDAPVQSMRQAAEAQAAIPSAVPPAGAGIEGQRVAEDEPEPDAEPDAEASAGSQGAGPEGTNAAAADKGPTAAKVPQPVTGAFGIPLGERFEPHMVTKVISQEEQTYRGPDKAETMGMLYRVEPKVPSTLFNSYAVAATADGVIYLIRGDQKPPEQKDACQAPKTLAAFLEGKYGKSRERGPGGEWFSIRDMSRPMFRGVRMHATRCLRGIYSIVYADDAARLQAPALEPESRPEPSETSGL